MRRSLRRSSQGPAVLASTNHRNLVRRSWVRCGDELDSARLFGRIDPVDARLIEAEAKLNANGIFGMMKILNDAAFESADDLDVQRRRVHSGHFRHGVSTGLTALPTPAGKDAATTLFLREKAFWTFGGAQRLGDLRRQVRQYARGAETAFPTGSFFKTGSAYGADVNLPVTVQEANNSLSKGCTDRKA